MDESVKLPKNVALVAQTMHTMHEDMSNVLLSKKQKSCSHSDYKYAHEEYNEDCRYCAIDACMIKLCNDCSKEYR